MDLTKLVTFNKTVLPIPPGDNESAYKARPESVVVANMPAGTYIKGEEMLMLRKDTIAELSRLLGRNIKDADDLLLAARNVTTLSIKGLSGSDITLEPYLLDRLRSRCHPTQDFPEFVRERIVELLSGYAGA